MQLSRASAIVALLLASRGSVVRAQQAHVDQRTAGVSSATGESTDPAQRSGAPGADDPDDKVRPEDLQTSLPDERKPDPDPGEPVTGTVRAGAYSDSDKTRVLRTLGVVSRTWGRWGLGASVGVDAVTSASVDVRSSPALSKVDVVTGASGRTSSSGGEMTDTRYQVTGGAGYKDTAGHAFNLMGAFATESDYTSGSAGLNGSYDVLDRTTTLLGGLTFTDNRISSVLDRSLHRKMFAVAWSVGVARVLTPSDAVRVRYDGKLSDGYQASPYRNVRFGDWTASLGEHQITFMSTMGSPDGLPELLPERRTSHAVVLEWVHSLAPGIGLHPQLRGAHDSWGVDSVSAAVDLRIAKRSWRMEAGYRYYLQSRADFFESKYLQAPTTYSAYTSDKELGGQAGHLVRFDISRVLIDAATPNDTRMMLNFQIDVVRYNYAGFLLLPSRDSTFASVGISWEL